MCACFRFRAGTSRRVYSQRQLHQWITAIAESVTLTRLYTRKLKKDKTVEQHYKVN